MSGIDRSTQVRAGNNPDLITRLRSDAWLGQARLLMREAADRIEALEDAVRPLEAPERPAVVQTQLEYLEARLGKLSERIDTVEADVGALGPMVHRHDLQLARRT